VKILFVGPLPEPITGQSLACQVFLDALRRRHEVVVVDTNRKTFRRGASLRRIWEVFSFARQVQRKSRGCDAVYFTISQSVMGNLKDLAIYLACFRLLPRMAVHLHGGPGMRMLLSDRHPLLRRLNAFFLRRLGAVIVLGERHRSIFAGYVRAGKIHCVPNFAEDALFVMPDRTREKFSAAGPLRFLFLSNLNAGKGHTELLQAIALLPPTVRGAIAVDFAGGFESEADKATFLSDLRQVPEARYCGIVKGKDKQALFAAAHVFCLPTYYAYEGQPISILEAYASGCAVMTTDHSGIFDVFEPGVNGYVVEKRSPQSIATAIGMAVGNAVATRDMALANLAQAKDLYRVETYNANLCAIMDLVAS
jgi:glycosyltransferase involved in cell wall biosynthesis